MRRSSFLIFSLPFIIATLIIHVPSASAACPEGQVENITDGTCEDAEGNVVGTPTEDPEGTLTEATLQQTIANDEAAIKKATDALGEPDEAYNGVMARVMKLFAWLAGAAMLTLEYSVYWTVVKMGDYVRQLGAITDAWTVFRDLGNIMLIFGFLAIGISTILNSEWYGGGKKMLPKLLIAAVFLNFSLFITSAIIDTSNLFATQFYKSITGSTVPSGDSVGDVVTSGTRGVSGKIMAQLGLQEMYGQVQNEQKARTLLAKGNPFIIGFMGSILFIILAFVLFSLAFVLVARLVILIFLLILAPVGFAGLAIPQLKNRAMQWWDMLFKQSLTAPVLLLLLYVALKVITSPYFLINRSSKNWLGSIEASDLPGFGSIVLSFLIAMGLLLAVVIAAKELSAFGAGAALNLGKKMGMGSLKLAGKGAWGATRGVTRYTASRTLGRGMHLLSQGIMRGPAGGTLLGRYAATTIGKGDLGFKEAKEKSAKAHEAYVKSRQAAIDEKHAPAIANARLQREAIDAKTRDARKAAETEKGAVTKEKKTAEEKVENLKKEANNQFNPNREQARQELEKAEKELASLIKQMEIVEQEVEEVEAPLKAAVEAEKKATDALTEEKKQAALAYAESARSALSWVITGPGGEFAGNKIIQDTLKKMTDVEKALDILRKEVAKEGEAAKAATGAGEKLTEAKEDLTKKTGKEAEEKKPAAPTP